MKQYYQVLKSTFSDKVFEDPPHIIDDLGGDEFHIVYIVVPNRRKVRHYYSRRGNIPCCNCVPIE